MRIPPDASPGVRQAFKELHQRLDTLGVSHAPNTDLKGKRMINAGDALADADYVTLRQLNDVLALARATRAAVAVVTGGTGTGGGGGGGDDETCTDTKPDYSGYVQAAKDALIAASFDIESGPCGGFEIIKQAVRLIAAVDGTVGLLDKPSGTNCGGYAIDIICFLDGKFYDALGSAGDVGGNHPTFNFVDAAHGGCDPTRYRPPI